jgi:hypothetical protein
MNNVLFDSKSTQDIGICIRSSIVVIILFVILWLIPFSNGFNMGWIGITGLFLIFMAYIVGFLYVPYRFMLTKTHLIIKRYCGDIVLPIKEIMEIRLFTANDKKGLFGYCRVDGIFLHYGLYSTKIHKTLHVYTRRDSNWMLLVTSKKKYIFAPNDIRLVEMVQNLKQNNYE